MSARPLRARQRLFWGSIRSGCSVADAAAVIGLSVTVGHRWFSDAGGMPPLQLLPPPSCRHLSLIDREAIFAGLVAGLCYAAIGRLIGRPTSTVTRELDANRLIPSRPRAVPLGQRAGSRGPIPSRPNYSPREAQQRFEARLARPKESKLAASPRLHEQVVARLEINHSPEQIAAGCVGLP